MAIDTARKRQSALIDIWDTIAPDGTIDREDREALIGQYVGIPASATSDTQPPGDTAIYDSAGLRKRLPDDWIIGKRCELGERGGYLSGALQIGATWEQLIALGINGTEYVDLWLYGQRIYRGRIVQPEWSVDSPEVGTLELSGLIERLKHYRCEAKYAYGQAVDISELFSRIVYDWVKISGRLPNLVVDAQNCSVPVQVFDQAGQPVATALDTLLDLAPDVAIWGFDVDDSGQDRIYIRPRAAAVAYRMVIGREVTGFAWPRDTANIINRLFLSGGVPDQPNLLANGSFEDVRPAGDDVANYLINPGFEDTPTSPYWVTGGGDPTRMVPGATGAYGNSRSGSAWLECDTTAEELYQDVAIIPLGHYTASVWARREKITEANSYVLTLDGLDAGNNVVTTISVTGPLTTTIYDRKSISQDWAGYPTVVKARIRLISSGGTHNDDGVLFDDAAIYETYGVGQALWHHISTGAAVFSALDWAYGGPPEPLHGAYCIRVVMDGISTAADTGEFYTLPSESPDVKTGERYTLIVRWQTDGVGGASDDALSIGATSIKSDNTQGTQWESDTIVGNPSTWTVASFPINTEADTVRLQVFIRVRTERAIYIDGVMLVQADVPVEVAENDAYWGQNYEAVIDVTDADLTGLTAAAAGSITTYGTRDGDAQNNDVTDRESLLTFAEDYFNAYAVPSVEANVRATPESASELLGFDGTVKLLNLPSAPDPLFPSRIRYEIGDSVEMSADLGSQRPTLARLLNLAQERKVT